MGNNVHHHEAHEGHEDILLAKTQRRKENSWIMFPNLAASRLGESKIRKDLRLQEHWVVFTTVA
jgi:hypothetical protein